MWEQVKQAMVESAREVCGSVKVERKNPERVWLNNEVKAEGRRKKVVWKEVLAVSDKEVKKDVWKHTEKRRERLKGTNIRAKKSK